MILNEQRIQLDDKEKELKNTFSRFNLQLENKSNEIKEVKSEVLNLRRQIEANERGLPDQENQMRGREPIERHNLLDWKKNLQERQERIIEGQSSLNQREEYLNMAMKHIEKEMQDDKKKIEKDHATLKEK